MKSRNTHAAMTTHVAVVAAVVAVATTMLVFAGYVQDAHARFHTGGVDKDGSWYVGEGLKQGDYFSYSMCHMDYKECSNFRLDLWIRGDIQDGRTTKWFAEAVAYDGSRIVKGQMVLGKIAPEPMDYTANLGAYRYAFKSSVTWLSEFATADSELGGKGSKEFRASWSKICDPGCPQVRPLALETVRAAGQDWDAVLIGWEAGGASSKIWIVDGFPFPIKAKTYAFVPEDIPPTEYEFVLLKYEENVKENPFSDVVGTSELLTLRCEANFGKDSWIKESTAGGMYHVHVCYGPEDPKQGGNMQWLVKFASKYDEKEFLNQVQFDILTVDEDMTPTRSLAAENGRQFLYLPSGQYLIDIPVREEPGEVNYVIWVYGISPESLIPSDPPDHVEIPIIVHEGNGTADAPPQVADEPPMPTAESGTGQVPIPKWVKSNVGWWAEGMMDDNSFVQAMQYLINRGDIQIPKPETKNDETASEVPSWVKISAGWWAEGMIYDNSFVQAMQFLIQNRVVVVPHLS